MILEHVTLRDFCLFRGEQTFDLTPMPAPRNAGTRAIVLFGGVNGAGKTTLLDAIQLALYGTRARCSKRAGLAYDEFLRKSIHHGVSEGDGAAISVAFRFASGGEDHLYDVCRFWNVQANKVREDLRVVVDGLDDRWHSEHWNQLVEDFFPLEVSQLFFFDAEKIRSLAEDETSSQVLGSAVKSLLGLDVAERLIADAAVVETNLRKKMEATKSRDDCADLENGIKELQVELDGMRTKRGELENIRRRTEGEVHRLEEEFKAAGGKHWEARGERKRRQEQLEKEVRECESGLAAFAATELPLSLLDDLLERVKRQDERERLAADVEVVRQILMERDDGLLDLLAEAKAPPSILRKIKKHLADDRQSRALTAKETASRLSLSAGARSMLHHLRSQRLDELQREAKTLLERRSQLDRDVKDVDRALSITPEDEEIGEFLKRLRAATERLAALNDEAKQLDRVMAERKADLEARKARLQAISEREAKEEFTQDDRQRMARIAGKTRVVMKEFLARATERKIDRLSDLITESFRYLLRKQTMVERIHIDPSSFAITLFSESGHALAKERLSEGEKQIFAISVLWGLARASAHPLPAIIDTPMARLDAAHRRHLVERYFPHASHQVLILSTDTEVDRHYYQALQPHIARAYHLDYDEKTRATQGHEGYFWEETPQASDSGSGGS
jgi:DNA sulfur modification protein DndD